MGTVQVVMEQKASAVQLLASFLEISPATVSATYNALTRERGDLTIPQAMDELQRRLHLMSPLSN
jgi:hypothetical protein